MPSTENESGVCLTGLCRNLKLQVPQRKERGLLPDFWALRLFLIFITYIHNLNIFLEQINICLSGFDISMDSLMYINVPHLINATSPIHRNAGFIGSAVQPRNV